MTQRRRARDRSPAQAPRTARTVALAACLWLVCGALPANAARVSGVDFEGNRLFSDRRLRGLCESALGFFRRAGFDEEVLEDDKEAILNAYRREGFLDARIVGQELKEDGEDLVRIRLHLEEGRRSMIAGLRFEGLTRFSQERAARYVKSKPGKPYRQRQLQVDQRALQNAYAAEGMLDAAIHFEAVLDSAGDVECVITVDEGEVLTRGEVRIEGLDKTHAEVVEEQLLLRQGDVLKYDLLRKSQTALYGTGLFRTVVLETAPADTSTPGTRDLLIRVRERPAGSVDLGIGYGTSERFRTRLSVSQDNVGGWARQLGVSTRFSRSTRSAEIGFSDPTAWSRDLAFNSRTFYARERNRNAGFTVRRLGTSIGLSYRLRADWVAQLSYTFERARLLADAGSSRTTSGVTSGLRRDSRDDLFNPSRGSFVEVKTELAGGFFGGQNEFVRSDGLAMAYLGLGSAVVLAARAEFRHIRPLGPVEEIVQYERLYIGGAGEVRGYERYQIGSPAGGRVAVMSQLELRLFSGRAVGAVIFVDTGQVWPGLSSVHLFDQRAGYGSGARYASPIGPLRFDVAFRRGPESLRDRLELYLGVGQAF